MAKKPAPDLTIPLAQARAFWHARQGLLNPSAADATTAISATGWARTLGGVDVYLALRARSPSLRRAVVDTAVANGKLRVVPAVRGCIYLVHVADVALTMALADELSRSRTERDLDKVGVTWDEIETLAQEVEAVLQDGACTPDALRRGLPKGAARSLGTAGKKVGLSSPLPVTLRQLEFRGRITRTPVGDRLDTERYAWRLVPNEETPPPAPDSLKTDVVERVLGWFGPLSIKETATWIGLPQRDVKAALAEIDHLTVAIEGRKDVAVLLASEQHALESTPPGASGWTFLPFEDNLFTVHGGPRDLTDPAHHDLQVEVWGNSKPSTIGEVRHIFRRPLLHGDQLAGFWEFDPDTEDVVVGTFDPVPSIARQELDAGRAELTDFIRGELGHGRSFSLDTDDALRQRAQRLRDMD